MAQDEGPFCWSDAWLLCSIIMVSDEDGARLEKIIAAGDAVNHAIFTFEEVKNGLAKLMSHNLIQQRGDLFSATQEAISLYEKAKKRASFLKAIGHMERLLSKMWNQTERQVLKSDYKVSLKLSRKKFETAVKNYQNTFARQFQ